MIKIEEDGFYLNGIGEILYIKEVVKEYLDENGNAYLIDGTFVEGFTGQYSLIGYIPKELHYYLLNTIKSYHSNNQVKNFIDREFKRGNSIKQRRWILYNGYI